MEPAPEWMVLSLEKMVPDPKMITTAPRNSNDGVYTSKINAALSKTDMVFSKGGTTAFEASTGVSQANIYIKKSYVIY